MQLSPTNPRISFLHASDLHLGASQYVNPTLSQDYLFALKQILQMALDKRVNFVLLGGDIFTSRDILPSIFNKTVQILQNFQIKCKNELQNQIPIITIEGNHDIRRYSHGKRLEQRFSWLQVLHNLGLLILLDIDLGKFPKEGFLAYDEKSKTGGFLKIGNVKIFGTSFIKHNFYEYMDLCYQHLPDLGESEDPNRSPTFNIFLQHFGIAGQMKNVPGKSYDQIKKLRKKIQYLGLGHYHKGFEIKNWIFNPGSAEAVSPIETTFKRGVFHCEIYQNNLNNNNNNDSRNNRNSLDSGSFSKKVKLIPLKNRRYYWISIQLPLSLRNSDAIFNFVRESVKKQWKTNFGNILSKEVSSDTPRLFLILRGIKPRKFSTHIQKQLKDRLANEFSAAEVRFYLKFTKESQSLDKFISIPIKYQKTPQQQIPSR
ncbi:MAG: metallophosphoesterase family protein [Promethearchaeota archaeon]